MRHRIKTCAHIERACLNASQSSACFQLSLMPRAIMRPCITENLKYHTINSHSLLLRYTVFYWWHISISEIYTLHEKLWKVRWPHVEKMHLCFYFIVLMPVYLQTALPSIDLVVKVFASVGVWVVHISDLIWAQKFTFLSKKTNQPLLFASRVPSEFTTFKKKPLGLTK